MGEMADFTNDGIMDDYEQYWSYREGRINSQDAYDLGLIDEFGSVIGNPCLIPSDPMLGSKKKKKKKKS
jgi:hypothetical protein